ncbi:hypothetical protein [Paraburkholderia sp. GAS348]|uniref:hypothetical protein n=1 Tax=Paraburkholderia sp. GAS348 TaxID=3035132 RepID=UPI003D1A8764
MSIRDYLSGWTAPPKTAPVVGGSEAASDSVETASMASGNPGEVALPLTREDRAKARADSRNSPSTDRAEAARRFRMRVR